VSRFSKGLILIRFKRLIGTLGVLLALLTCGRRPVKDLLDPDDRRWLEANQDRIILGMDRGYAPFEFIDENGSPAGLALDHVALLEAKLGVRFTRRDLPTLHEIFQQVRSGKIQVVDAVTETPERATFLAFTRPYITVPNVIIVRKDRSGSLREGDLAKGLRISLVRSYAVTEYMLRKYPGLEPEQAPDDLAALLDVSFGRTEAAVIDLTTASYLIQTKGIANLKVAGEVGLPIQLSMATAKGETRLRGILEKGLGAITEAESQAIRDRWISAANPGFLGSRRFWLLLGALAATLLGILAMILVWNRTLRRKVALRTRDLAEEKRALEESEKALRESQKRLGDILNSVNACVFMKDREFRYTYVNPSVCELFGRPAAEILGRGDGSFFSAESVLEILRSDRPVIERGETVAREERDLNAADGRPRTFWAVKIPLRDDSGEIYGLCGISTDISLLKQAEAERRDLQHQLQQAQKMDSLGTLAGGVAHDMNNVLGAILGLASANLEILPEGTPTYQAFATISKAAVRGGKMVKSLLNFARMSSAEARVLDLNTILNEDIQLLERTTLAQVRLDIDLAPDLHPMRGDASSLTHAIMNLCVNAVDAMPENGTLTLSTRNVDGQAIEVLVQDTGSGMTKDVLDKALDPFFTTKEQGKGTGLGLSMVYATVKAHQGTLDIQSEPGRGTRIRLRFPACPGAMETGAEVDPRVKKGSARRLSILVVDDDPLIQSSFRAQLDVLGHEVVTTPCGEDALGVLRSGLQPDLVILDMNMPGLGGRGTLPLLRVQCPTVPVLIVTGRGDQGALDLVQSHAHVSVLLKPFTLKDLQDQLRHLSGDEP